jgi:hypothetical protein
MNKMLGKISKVSFGLGGYQDAMIGIHFSFSSTGMGVSTTKSYWDANLIKVNEYTKWTEEKRKKEYAAIMYYISDLLKKAKVQDVMQLTNIPVELTFEDNTLKDWRILTEVLL